MLRTSLIAISTLAMTTLPAFADGLSATQTVEVPVISTDQAGATQVSYIPAEDVAPGDEVRYALTYTHDGNEAANNVQLVMPIPVEIDFVDGSVEAGAATVTYSVDGERFFSRNALTRTDAAGNTQPASASDITHVRWAFTTPIAPGTSGQVSYRGILK